MKSQIGITPNFCSLVVTGIFIFIPMETRKCPGVLKVVNGPFHNFPRRGKLNNYEGVQNIIHSYKQIYIHESMNGKIMLVPGLVPCVTIFLLGKFHEHI